MNSPSDSPIPPKPTANGRPLATVLLVLYVLFLCGSAYLGRQQDLEIEKSVWDLQDTRQLLEWMLSRLTAGLIDFARFALLGFLTRLATGGSFSRGFFSLGVGLALTTVVLAFSAGGLPYLAGLVLPWTGCLLGIWIGSRWLRGPRARLWLVPQILLLLLLVAAGVVGLVFLAVEDTPLSFDAAQVTSDEKRRLVELFRKQRSGQVNGVVTRSLHLTERDADALLAWGLSLGSAERKAKMQLGEGDGALLASARVPSPLSDASYINFQGAAQCEVAAGRLRLRLEQIQVGRASVPQFVLRLLSPFLVSAVSNDPQLGRILASVESLQIEPGILEVVYRKETFAQVPALLERLGNKPNVLTSTTAQIDYLLSIADRIPKGEERFGALMEAAFAKAQERSSTFNPALENRAAIYALAVLVGHHRVADLVGLSIDQELARKVRRGVRPVSIRGRADWSRHYFLSAALAQLSVEAVSDAMGLLKEEMDAGEGGSGFSFSDLLADRAGTLFSLAATRDEPSARLMQDRLKSGFHVKDYFPPAADLPEGIPDDELQSRYGGVDGPGYRQLVQDIEDRLSRCAALR